MIKDAREEMPLASINGISCLYMPYTSQQTVPVNMRVYMGRDRSVVDFVRMVLMTCGKKAVVVKMAADKPISSIKFIKEWLKMRWQGGRCCKGMP